MYLPTSETLQRLATESGVARLLEAGNGDWDCRQWLSPPGLVWSVASDTCMSGRLDAPGNIAYGEFGQEFVFRQPRDEQELSAVLLAASHEVYDCYRFDGLSRWTSDSANAWLEMVNVIKGWLDHCLGVQTHAAIASGLRDYRSYRDSDEFSDYWTSLIARLAPG